MWRRFTELLKAFLISYQMFCYPLSFFNVLTHLPISMVNVCIHNCVCVQVCVLLKMLFLWGRDKKLSESVFQRPHTRFPFLTGTKLFMQMPGSILTFTSPLYAVVRWVTGIFFMKEMSWDVVWNASVSKFVWEKLFCGAAVFFFLLFFQLLLHNYWFVRPL